MTTFIDGVNRILRSQGIIKGDDDDITAFSSTQHAATLELAKIAIQSEITHLVANNALPGEKATDTTITTNGSTRTYTLASDFVRFRGDHPFFLEVDSSDVSLNNTIFEFPGGEDKVRRTFLDYKSNEGQPHWWYFTGSTTWEVGLFPVPDSTKIYRYAYSKDVQVTTASDTLPFSTASMDFMFLEVAERRFTYLFASEDIRKALFPQGVERDPGINEARASLFHLLQGRDPPMKYGRRYA